MDCSYSDLEQNELTRSSARAEPSAAPHRPHLDPGPVIMSGNRTEEALNDTTEMKQRVSFVFFLIFTSILH